MTDLKRGDSWVSIDDALPSDGEYIVVVARVNCDDTDDRFIATDEYCVNYGWFFYDESMQYTVTHWMPSPPLPEGDE